MKAAAAVYPIREPLLWRQALDVVEEVDKRSVSMANITSLNAIAATSDLWSAAAAQEPLFHAGNVNLLIPT